MLVSPRSVPRRLGSRLARTAELESRGFADAYRRLAEDAQVPLLDLAPFAESSPLDGIHFEASDHESIGRAVAAAVRDLLELR